MTEPDGRSMSSRINGRKGGRPLTKKITVFISKEDIVSALRKGDIAEAIEKGLQKSFPEKKIYVQTVDRLEKAGVNYDPHTGVNNIVFIDDMPNKFNWQLRYFVTDFIVLTKGKKDFKFQMVVPTPQTLDGKEAV